MSSLGLTAESVSSQLLTSVNEEVMLSVEEKQSQHSINKELCKAIYVMVVLGL